MKYILLIAATCACSNAASLLRGNSNSPACANDADTSIWTSKGKASFNADMNTCGKKCLGGASCVQGCIKSAEGYSDDCSACFGALGGCTAKNCMGKCIGGQTPAGNALPAHRISPRLRVGLPARLQLQGIVFGRLFGHLSTTQCQVILQLLLANGLAAATA